MEDQEFGISALDEFDFSEINLSKLAEWKDGTTLIAFLPIFSPVRFGFRPEANVRSAFGGTPLPHAAPPKISVHNSAQ
ncbi:MAG: hypothetical protein IPP17_28690 [Bacteroidetes bacterium]|nr:hypothetical protein [Bacteroidota bacterium]